MTWRNAACLPVLRSPVNARFPNRDKASDGTIGDEAHARTESDHNPDENGVVRAQDFDDDTRDPQEPSLGKWLGERLRLSRDPRISYFISYGRIFYGPAVAARRGVQPWTWLVYTGTRDPHDTHCHLSVVDGPAADDTRPWVLQLPGEQPQEDDMAYSDWPERDKQELAADVATAFVNRSLGGVDFDGSVAQMLAAILGQAKGANMARLALDELPARIAERLKTLPAGEAVDVQALAAAVVTELGQQLDGPE
jgi:hypothetical protein